MVIAVWPVTHLSSGKCTSYHNTATKWSWCSFLCDSSVSTSFCAFVRYWWLQRRAEQSQVQLSVRCDFEPVGARRFWVCLGIIKYKDWSHYWFVLQIIWTIWDTVKCHCCLWITDIAFYVSTRPIDGAGGIMFLGCPSICAHVSLLKLRHSLTGLSSTPSCCIVHTAI